MSEGRHSYIQFYPSDWIAGTARMTRMQRSVYFDICCYCWDKAVECPETELPLMLGDVDGWREIVDTLVAAGKLYRTPDGSVGNTRAVSEAQKALGLWLAKSKGGKSGAAKTNKGRRGDGNGDDTPEKTPDDSGDGSAAKSGDGTRAGVSSQNQNQNQKNKNNSSEPNGSAAPSAASPVETKKTKPDTEPAEQPTGLDIPPFLDRRKKLPDKGDKWLFDLLREIGLPKAGGQITRLRNVGLSDLEIADILREAGGASDPGQYLGGVVKHREADKPKAWAKL